MYLHDCEIPYISSSSPPVVWFSGLYPPKLLLRPLVHRYWPSYGVQMHPGRRSLCACDTSLQVRCLDVYSRPPRSRNALCRNLVVQDSRWGLLMLLLLECGPGVDLQKGKCAKQRRYGLESYDLSYYILSHIVGLVNFKQCAGPHTDNIMTNKMLPAKPYFGVTPRELTPRAAPAVQTRSIAFLIIRVCFSGLFLRIGSRWDGPLLFFIICFSRTVFTDSRWDDEDAKVGGQGVCGMLRRVGSQG